ncbi:MAG: WD40 repeat domain-containing serine/threonine protein kinase [Streptosporangiaceae bacterium]
MQGGVGMLVAGRYFLAEAVGQGGMGRVWRGHDQLLDRVVAVKEVILPLQSPGEHAELLARTMREARAAARLDHPGVITIYDVVEHGGSPWIVMQFVSGVSVRGQMDRDGRLPWPHVADIGEQVAGALAAAHAAGIVHRDLKPDNILLSGRRAIVTDFGIARIIDATTQLTGAGVLVGTPLYMAPEHLDGGAIGPPADMWALGATLYCAVEGTPPFNGSTMTALMAAILTRLPAHPQHAGPLLEVISVLLSKDPGQRPSAQAVARTLAACRSGRPVSSSAADVSIAATAPRDLQGNQFQDGPAGERLSSERSREGRATITTSGPFPPVSGRPGFPGVQNAPTPRLATELRPRSPGRVLVTRNRFRRPRALAILVAAIAVAAAVPVALLALPGGGKSPGIATSTSPTPTGQYTSATAHAGRPASTSAPTGPVMASRTAILTDPGSEGVQQVAFGPDGTLAVADGNGNTYLWNTAIRSPIATLTDPRGEGPMNLVFGPNGTLAVVDGNGSTYLWNTATRSLIATLTDPQNGGALDAAFGPDGTLAVGDAKSGTYLWNTTTRSVITTLTDSDCPFVLSVAFGPDGTLAVAGNNGRTCLWNTATRSLITTLTDPPGYAETLAFGPDGILAVASETGNTYLWNATTRDLIATLTDPGSKGASAVAFGPDGTLAVVDGNDHTYLWNTASRSVIATLTDPQVVGAAGVAFGPEGTLAVGELKGTYLWRVSSGKS